MTYKIAYVYLKHTKTIQQNRSISTAAEREHNLITFDSITQFGTRRIESISFDV